MAADRTRRALVIAYAAAFIGNRIFTMTAG